ncbi:unnamed protein product [Brassicogethes aeneus]|uniref:Myotubularin phosphatase domain-containing protein n=1 Tax=Brassicogethes aeneus TaxID=1431903 RepID=A0A9P0BAL5_BRAAE|nr:unnamed protein product [Brassicogethes aeneus]
MTDLKESGFKSYLDESGLETIKLNDLQQTKLLDGETTVSTANNVMLFNTLSDKKKGTYGILTVTTFKLSFACASDNGLDNFHQQNLLLGMNDICLSSIATIYQTGERTKKKLIPGQNISGKIKELLIICKNMRSFEFSFKDSEKDGGKTTANALIHHAYPKRHSLLFAYDYLEPYVKSPQLAKEVTMFRKKEDWSRELRRTKCENWRISDLNQNYQTSPYLTQSLIVPLSISDFSLIKSVEHFNNRFCPVWVWGTAKGAALVRMADLLPAISDSKYENELFEHIRKSHPDLKQPIIINLNCISSKDVQASYLKLRDICVPDSSRMFKRQDFKLYGLLDNSKWLALVSTCLGFAVEAADCLHKKVTTVVLQEGNGQDTNCIISSLCQIILDPYFRTKPGFQSLIQKEWVSLGHPFAYRLGHIHDKDVETAPFFLLFLDCVWQLQLQHPAAFQFSETYLTTLWDSAHITLFDTFIFNNDHQRMMAESGTTNGASKLVLRSIWDWREQFSESDLIFFANPLYQDNYQQILEVKHGISSLEIWSQCYFRWLPELEIKNGGRPVLDLYNRILVNEILNLRHGQADANGRYLKNIDEQMDLLKKVNSFFPFSHNLFGQTSASSNIFLSSDVLDTQSVFNLTTE